MYKFVRLQGDDKEYLSIDLYQILKQIATGSSYLWRVLWISGFGKTENDITIMTLEDQINGSKDGVFYAWESLFEFTTGTLQLHEFLLLGDIKEENLHRYEKEEDMQQNCMFCIELIDSSYWEIFTKDPEFMNNIKKSLR